MTGGSFDTVNWGWASTKVCAGCDRKLLLKEVLCWHSQGGERVIFCIHCFPLRWKQWMNERSCCDDRV